MKLKKTKTCKYSLATSEGRIQSKKAVQLCMRSDLETAKAAYVCLAASDLQIILYKVEKLKKIKYRIEDKAQSLGYSKACRESIPVCKGQCCIWHFPKMLSFIDFFIMVCSLSKIKLVQLSSHLSNFHNTNYQCPLLKDNGCFLEFDTRPMVCTNAYPCFMEDQYWQFMAAETVEIRKIYRFMKQFCNCSGE